jgi:polygalacturonase
MNTRRKFLQQAGIGLLAIPATSLAAGAIPTRELSADQAIAPDKPAQGGNMRLNIHDFGAVGDGKTMNTFAIQQTIDRCSLFGGGVVTVPSGEYLTGAIALRSNTTLHLEEGAVIRGSSDFKDYAIMQVRWEGKWIQGYSGLIYALGAHNIGITGPGKIAGSKSTGGRPNGTNPLRHPSLIEPIDCTNITFDGFSTEYQLMWSVHLTFCDNITIKNLHIRSTGGNGDGIDVDSCRNVVIDNCDIEAGDDCISLKSGRGMEGYKLLRTTENVTITNCTFKGLIFACIGIGSETSGGIRKVRIEHCKFIGAKTFALYMKSRIGRGAFVEDITANDLDVSGMEGGMLRFNLMGSGLQDQVPVPGLEGIPTTKNFKFTNIRVKDVPVLVDGTGVHPDKPLDGFVLSNITGTCKKGISLINTKNAQIKDINVTGYTGPLLSIYNVTGSGLKGATVLPAPKIPEPVPAPTTPYELK